jgi:penicillin amidase
MRRRIAKAAVAAAVLLAIVVVAIPFYARRSLPHIDGRVTVRGLSDGVEIIRDQDAIPHIFASSMPDALFGLGYAHAQDRLWQMEFQRRVGHGRLAEIFGEAAVPQDRFLRTVGFGRAANAAWERTPAWARERINAYVGGVNAFIDSHTGPRLPPEFAVLRFAPEPWTGVDVVVWVKMMAWDLSGNYTVELLRDDLVRAVGPERMQQLMPMSADDALSIVAGAGGPLGSMDGHGSIGATPRTSADYIDHGARPGQTPSHFASLIEALSAGLPAFEHGLVGGGVTESLGSNNWVVDGSLTASGKPLLANDPHLSTKLPSTWYLAHLSVGDFDLIGATLPGTPAIALGRNSFIAWGATNVSADVEDLYRERLDETGRASMFRGAPEPLTIVPETIRVKGGTSVRVDVRVTRHGPLVSDAINAINAASNRSPKPAALPPLALRWTALDADDTTLPAFLKVNESRNWGDFTAALRDFVVPSQNFVYADIDGHIGYYAPGRIPKRSSGNGTLPVDGSAGEGEWTGWIPFEDLPHVLDPAEHFIVTANNRPMPNGYPYSLGTDWPEPYRATRIVDLLRNRRGLTADDFAAIQRDTISLHARQLLPLLLDRVRPTNQAEETAVELLRQWDGNMDAASAAASIFEAWFLRLPATMIDDSLGLRTASAYDGRFSFVTRFLVNTLKTNDAFWCDDTRTPAAETCDEAVTAALRGAVRDLADRLGSDMSRWRWDGVHRAVFPHQGLDVVRQLRPLLSRSTPTGGDWSTVNVGSVSTDQPYEQRSVAGYRSIVDLSPANDSRFIIDLGQSGHPLSAHYDDFLDDWRAVRHRPMRTNRAEIEKGALGHLRLTAESSEK